MLPYSTYEKRVPSVLSLRREFLAQRIYCFEISGETTIDIIRCTFFS